jgi:hypothetical protein
MHRNDHTLTKLAGYVARKCNHKPHLINTRDEGYYLVHGIKIYLELIQAIIIQSGENMRRSLTLV